MGAECACNPAVVGPAQVAAQPMAPPRHRTSAVGGRRASATLGGRGQGVLAQAHPAPSVSAVDVSKSGESGCTFPSLQTASADSGCSPSIGVTVMTPHGAIPMRSGVCSFFDAQQAVYGSRPAPAAVAVLRSPQANGHPALSMLQSAVYAGATGVKSAAASAASGTFVHPGPGAITPRDAVAALSVSVQLGDVNMSVPLGFYLDFVVERGAGAGVDWVSAVRTLWPRLLERTSGFADTRAGHNSWWDRMIGCWNLPQDSTGSTFFNTRAGAPEALHLYALSVLAVYGEHAVDVGSGTLQGEGFPEFLTEYLRHLRFMPRSPLHEDKPNQEVSFLFFNYVSQDSSYPSVGPESILGDCTSGDGYLTAPGLYSDFRLDHYEDRNGVWNLRVVWTGDYKLEAHAWALDKPKHPYPRIEVVALVLASEAARVDTIMAAALLLHQYGLSLQAAALKEPARGTPGVPYLANAAILARYAHDPCGLVRPTAGA